MADDELSDARLEAERVAREGYGRLLAFLTSRTHDMAAAEDALADAFAAALAHWPVTGVPQVPEAWLLVTARRRIADEARRHPCANGIGTSSSSRPRRQLRATPRAARFPTSGCT